MTGQRLVSGARWCLCHLVLDNGQQLRILLNNSNVLINYDNDGSCALFSEIFLFSPKQPQPPSPRWLHIHGVSVAGSALQPVVGGGGQVAEVILEGRMVTETETSREQEAEDEVGEQQEAVRDQEHVEKILLNPDHCDSRLGM